MAPSAEWKERIAPDEEARFAHYAESLASLQARISKRQGTGRALHRKQLLSLRAQLEVDDGLPAHARHGVFAAPGVHEAWVRLSNGGAVRTSDLRPDIRGFAVKVLGVKGPGALAPEATSQDFLFVNHETFVMGTSEAFVELALNAAKGPVALVSYLVRRYGALGAVKTALRVQQMMSKAFTGFATEVMSTVAPLCCGPYAIKVRIVPHDVASGVSTPSDLAADVTQRVQRGALTWKVQLQFYVDDARTPLEDVSVPWPIEVAPWTTVGKLTVPRQDPTAAEGLAFANQVEQALFDPWGGLAVHRPLGDMMRARKAAYYASQKNRGVA